MGNRLSHIIACVLLSCCPLAAQNWRDSLTTLHKQIELHPHSTDLRLKKAAVNIELQQWEYAAEEYGRVLELDGKNLAALYFRAYAYNHLRRYDLARSDYERFLHILPRHFDARLGLAMTLRNLNRLQDTQDQLNQLVEMFPDSALAYAARADFEQEQRLYELALYDWDEALSRSPRNAAFMRSKHEVLLALRRYDEARRLQLELARMGYGVK